MLKASFIIIAGPTGVGKEAILHVVKHLYRFFLPVSYTTRAPRPGERDGVDYRFVDDITFRKMIKNGEFLEYARVHNRWFYGTVAGPVLDALKRGQNILAVIDVKGAAKIQRKLPGQTVIIYVQYDPSRPLAAQIRSRFQRDPARRQMSEEQIGRRIRTAYREERVKTKFDYRVTNADGHFEEAVDQIKQIIQAFLIS